LSQEKSILEPNFNEKLSAWQKTTRKKLGDESFTCRLQWPVSKLKCLNVHMAVSCKGPMLPFSRMTDTDSEVVMAIVGSNISNVEEL
jgi:hypothetical protein